MWESLSYAFRAVAPIMPLMALGYAVRRLGYFDADTLKKLNAFAFRFPMCALMFCNIYSLHDIFAIRPDVIGLAFLSLAVITAGGWLLSGLVTDRRARRGVIIQASFRSNFAVIGLILASNLCGAEGAAAATGIQAPGILYYNVAAVVCLSLFSEKREKSVGAFDVCRQILTNPMILGIAAGLLCLTVRGLLPRGADGTPMLLLSRDAAFLFTCVKSLADMTTPLVLITLGAQLDFSAVSGMRRELTACILMRLVGAPAIGLCVALGLRGLGLLTLTPPTVSAVLGFWGAPMAVAGAIMAEEMGCDGELARQCAIWTSALSLFTLFLWILILRFVGLL